MSQPIKRKPVAGTVTSVRTEKIAILDSAQSPNCFQDLDGTDGLQTDGPPPYEYKIVRKPLLRSQPSEAPIHTSPETTGDKTGRQLEAFDEWGFAPVSSGELGELHPDLDEQLANLQLETESDGLSNTLSSTNSLESTVPPTTPAAPEIKPSKFKAELKHAFDEVKHFAGGLVSHPYEATKYHSILRHSPGVVFYSGPTTSVTITIFSAQPLPENRTLWLQKRGLSGNTGMTIKSASGLRSSWIDITPILHVTPDRLPHTDERAWQRDIAKHVKKVQSHKHISKHRLRQTNVLRIPHVAEDGYFRIVLCAGPNNDNKNNKKVLCPSPVFRYASSSLDPSVLRGASFSTLPLELGIKVGSIISRHAASVATQNALQPVTSAVQNVVKPYELDGLTQWATRRVYDASGVEGRIGGAVRTVDREYDGRRERQYRMASGDEGTGGLVRAVTVEEGPASPFPIQFSGRVVRGAGKGRERYGVPTACLGGVGQDVLLRLSGVYMGWASICRPSKDAKTPSGPATELKDAYGVWYPAVILVTPRDNDKALVVQQKDISIYLHHDFDLTTFHDSKLQIITMGFLHGTPSSTLHHSLLDDPDHQHKSMQNDMATTLSTLQHPAWSPEAVLSRIKSDSSDRSLTQRVADVRAAAQKQADRVPIHMLGVRTDSGALRDQLVGRGGFCVRR